MPIIIFWSKKGIQEQQQSNDVTGQQCPFLWATRKLD